MDVEVCNDENVGGEFSKSVKNTARTTPAKIPLKPVNDSRRLTASPQMIPDTEDMKTPRTSPYTYIRQLDSAERWIERTTVVTKQDHIINMQNAAGILEDLVDSLPLLGNNTWLTEALADVSNSEEALKAARLPAVEHSSDLDELADLLGGLDIGYRTPAQNEIRKSRCDSEQPVSQRISGVGKVQAGCMSVEDAFNTSSDSDLVPMSAVCSMEAHAVGENLEAEISNLSDKLLNENVNLPDGKGRILSSVCESQILPGHADRNQHLVSHIDNTNNNAEAAKSKSLVSDSTAVDRSSIDPATEELQPVNSQVDEDRVIEEAGKQEMLVQPILNVTPGICEEPAAKNQPSSTVVDTEPFKLNLQLANSPVNKEPASEELEPAVAKDPFKPKLQLVNSPVNKEPASEELEPAVAKDPFKPKLQLVNSPVNKEPASEGLEPAVAKDPFKPKLQLVNSPVNKEPASEGLEPAVAKDPFKPKLQLVNSPVNKEPACEGLKPAVAKDPFKPKLQLVNSSVNKEPASELDLAVAKDPFKPKLQLVNSPVNKEPASEELEPVVAEDPFKPKLQLVNSHVNKEPASEELEPAVAKDPFKPKLQLVNSPVNKEPASEGLKPAIAKDPFKPKLQLVNSPVNKEPASEELDLAVAKDPFKPKLQLVNSPVNKEPASELEPVVAEDPFKPKLQLVNSPVNKEPASEGLERAVAKDPFKPKLHLVNSPVNKEPASEGLEPAVAKDPFKPKLQLMNSPVNKEPASEGLKPAVDKDPFKPKLQLVNSHVNKEPASEELDLAVAKDPFKPKLQLVNSPVNKEPASEELEPVVAKDPFKPKLQLANSPVNKEPASELDPDVAKDPFTPKLQLVNSPVSEELGDELNSCVARDPLQCKRQLLTSSSNDHDNMSKELEPVLTGGPFQPKQQLLNSPIVNAQTSIGREPNKLVDDADHISHPLSKGQTADRDFEDSDVLHMQLPVPVSDDASNQVQLQAIVEDTLTSTEVHFSSPAQPAQNVSNTLPIAETTCLDTCSSPPVPLGGSQQLAPNACLTNSSVIDGDNDVNKSHTGSYLNTIVPNRSGKQLYSSSAETCQNSVDMATESNLPTLAVDMGTESNKPTLAMDMGTESNLLTLAMDVGTESNKPTVVMDMGTESNKPTLAMDMGTESNLLTLAMDVGTESNKLTVVMDMGTESNKPTLAMDMGTESNLLTLAMDVGTESNKLTVVMDMGTESNKPTLAMDMGAESNLFTLAVDMATESDKPTLAVDIATSQETNTSTQAQLIHSHTIHGDKVVTSSLPATADQALESKYHEESSKIVDKPVDGGIRQAHSVLTPARGDMSESRVSVTEGKTLSVCPSEEESLDIAEEEFIPATQAFNDPSFLDMLEKCGSTCKINPKRGSVLLRFDPLQEVKDQGFAKPASPGPGKRPPRVSDIFNQSKSTDDSVCLFGTPPRAARRRTLTRRVHNTRVQSIEEETGSSEVDAIFGLDDDQGMDTILHDNLLPLAISEAMLVDVGELAVYTESDMKHLRAELTMHFQELLLKRDKEFQEKLKLKEEEAALEVGRLKAEVEGYKSKVKSLHAKQKALNEVMLEYTDTISKVSAEKDMVMAEKELLGIQLSEMKTFNNQMHEDNKDLEKSFQDLFHRYEKLKTTLEKAAENEKILKQAFSDAQEKYKLSKETNKKIKEMAEQKIAELEEKYEKLSASTKDDIMRLEASVKRKEMQNKALETSLEQKIKENRELTDLCDTLINKVSSS